MHRVTRSWNVPLGLALFGSTVLVGGAILAYPQISSAPSTVDVGDPIATRPFPSFPDEVPSVAGNHRAPPPYAPISPRPPLAASTGVSAAPPTEATPLPANAPPPLSAPTALGGGPRAEEGGERAETPSATNVPQTTSTPVNTPASVANTPASVATGATSPPSTPATTGALTTKGGTKIENTTPYVVPIYGGGPLGPPPGPQPTPTVGGATGDTPLWTSGAGTAGAGGSNGGSSGSNAGVVNPTPAITAPLLVPMHGTAGAETYWTSISPFLRSGDLVIARTSTADALGFSERVRVDAPLVGYVVAFDQAGPLTAALGTGLPAAVAGVGLSSTDGLSEPAFNDLATKVHAAGKKLFVSTTLPSHGLSLAAIGARADVVELVVPGANATATTQAVMGAKQAMGNKPTIFVRLPDAVAGSGAMAARATGEITTALPSAGVSLPTSTNASQLLSDMRATP